MPWSIPPDSSPSNIGDNRGSYLVGPSTRNVRIERQWRQVGESVTQMFAHLFLEMEQAHDLYRDEPVDLYCLHYVFLPYFNYILTHYVDGWNHHGMSNRGLGGLSPIQMWYRGKLGHQLRYDVARSDRTNPTTTRVGMIEAYNNGFDLDLFPIQADNADEVAIRHNMVQATRMQATEPSGDQSRQPRNRDPHVNVSRFRDHLPEFILSDEFDQQIRERLPNRHWPTMHEAVDQYLAVRAYVHDVINAF